MKILSLIFTLVGILLIGTALYDDAFAQAGEGSPFERKFGDVKFLDAFFGLPDQKLEVNPGDSNVPFTIIIANVGTQDITGIRGQLSMPFGFSPTVGSGSVIIADFESNALAGEVFELTFFVDISEQAKISQYPGSAMIEYSRIRESGVRNAFFDFNFKVTGDSVINMRALDPFLTSLQKNKVIIEISNGGTAPISGVDIALQNTQGTMASNTQSVTNVENVVILESDWDVGHIDPGTSQYIEFEVYVPETMKSQTLRSPMDITYFDAHGEQHTISRIVDFYVKGLIDLTIYDVGIIDLSGSPTVIGEIINEGNEDALFGFVTLEPLGDSHIKTTRQYIDEIEIDAPVPFNIPIVFDGEPTYGENDVKITVRYKDSLRDEIFQTYETTVFVPEPPVPEKGFDIMEYSQYIVLGIIAIVGAVSFSKIKNRKKEAAK